MKNYNQILIGAVILCFTSCQSESTETESVDKPLEEKQLELSQVVSSPFENPTIEPVHIEVDSEVGGSFKFAGGSRLTVPENAFIDSDGNPVKGKVDVFLKEFNSLSEILYSGVNMKYDSAQASYDFVSAGMFHLSGKQNGKDIQVKKDKSLTFSSATDIEDTPCYNFYEMDEDNSWKYLTTKKAEKNPDYEEVEQFKKPKEASSDDLIFELDFISSDKIFSEYEGLLWKYAGNRQDTVNQAWLRSITADQSKISKTKDHQLSFELETTIENKKYVFPVEPVLSGDDYEKALSKFNSTMSSIEKNEEAMLAMQEGEFVRTIDIPSFGMYNWDVIHKSNRSQMIADIKLKDGPSPSLCTIFLVSKSDNSVVTYAYSDLNKFSFNPNTDNHLIVTIPGNKVAVLDSRAFFQQIKASKESGSVVFKPETLAESVQNSNDIQRIIESL